MRYLIIFVFCFLVVNHCNSQWFTQSSGTNKTLNKVVFTSLDTGYIAGGGFFVSGETGILLKTTNNGLNWLSQNYGSVQKVYNLYFFNSLTGYATGNGNLLIKTTNGGVNWVGVNLPETFSAIGSVFFTAKDTGFVCGNYSKDFILLKTYNGGLTWSQKLYYAGTIYSGKNTFYFINNNTGFATKSGYYFKTTNAGENWEIVFGGSSKELFFFNDLTGIGISGDQTGGAIYRTINQGVNWQTIQFGISHNALRFLNNNVGIIACDSGVIKYTYNAGLSWSRITSGTTFKNNFNSIYFISQSTGYIVGDSGLILKTTNSGGLTFINNSNQVVDNFILYQNYPNPFNPSTKINYELKKSANIELNVYDANGRLIKILESGYKPAGNYETNFSAEGLSSGVYYYSLYADGVLMDTKKAVVMK